LVYDDYVYDDRGGIDFCYSRIVCLRDELVPLPLYIHKCVYAIEMALD
jgi:hypothetical protein